MQEIVIFFLQTIRTEIVYLNVFVALFIFFLERTIIWQSSVQPISQVELIILLSHTCLIYFTLLMFVMVLIKALR